MMKTKTDLEKAEKKVDKRKMEMILEGLSFFGLKENSMMEIWIKLNDPSDDDRFFFF